MTIDVSPQAAADELFALLGTGRQTDCFSARGRFDLPAAYEASARLRRLREGAGEVAVGRKIGFTNQTIWDEYGVSAPIWNYVYDRTVIDLDGDLTVFGLAGASEPRIEPEIVLGLAAAPTLDMSDDQLLGAIDFVGHGFEIVQSVFPGWRFSAPDTVAAYGLHAALLIGERHPVRSTDDRAAFAGMADIEVALSRDGAAVDSGRGRDVLGGGPLAALRHLICLLDGQDLHPPLRAGEIVTTGTLTNAHAVAAGQRWSTRLSGTPLRGETLAFA